MQQVEFQQKMLESINASLGNIPITKEMGGHTFHSVGLVHVHVESDLVASSIIELAFWIHGASDRIEWLRDFMVKLTDKGHEIAGEELEPDPSHEGGFHVRLDAKRLYGRPGKLQIIERG